MKVRDVSVLEFHSNLVLPSPEESYEEKERKGRLRILFEEAFIVKLKPREAIALRMYYGFDGIDRTLRDVGAVFNLSQEGARQIIVNAKRKLRLPYHRKNELRDIRM